MPKGPLKLRELRKILKKSYGVVELHKRGKGSEFILLLPNSPGSKKGPIYPIKNHGPSTEIKVPVINAILRRFNISPDDFWD